MKCMLLCIEQKCMTGTAYERNLIEFHLFFSAAQSYCFDTATSKTSQQQTTACKKCIFFVNKTTVKKHAVKGESHE